ncbi:hypothetical protein AX17_002555 [Amanita inopinata Kibby_2008]|nr:hypothetical protein AX17_002555 [Amanita inopinata Kibby_2008]
MLSSPSSSTLTPLPQAWLADPPFGCKLVYVESDGRSDCSSFTQERDEDLQSNSLSKLNELFIIAGLTSSLAVAGTFESYKWLQGNPSGIVARLFAMFPAQLKAATGHDGVAEDSSLDPFVPDAMLLRIHILWLLSLALNIVTLLVGLTCLRYIRDYQKSAILPDRQWVAPCTMPFQKGPRRWKVPTIIAALYFLLHMAIVLFLAGILLMAWRLDTVVGGIVTSLVALVSYFMVTTFTLPFIIFSRSVFSRARYPCRTWFFHQFSRVLSFFGRVGRNLAAPCSSVFRKIIRAISSKWRRSAVFSQGDDFIIHAIVEIDLQYGHRPDVMFILYHCIRELDTITIARIVSSLRQERSTSAANNAELLGKEQLMSTWLELHDQCLTTCSTSGLAGSFKAESTIDWSLLKQGDARVCLPSNIFVDILTIARSHIQDCAFPKGIFRIIRSLLLVDGSLIDLTGDPQQRVDLSMVSLFKRCESLVISGTLRHAIQCAVELHHFMLYEPTINQQFVDSWEFAVCGSAQKIIWDSILSLVKAVHCKLGGHDGCKGPSPL